MAVRRFGEGHYVTFKTANLSIEKGFDGRSCRFYTYGELLDTCPLAMYSQREFIAHLKKSADDMQVDFDPKEFIICPTQSALASWLRTAHGIYVEITVDFLPEEDGRETSSAAFHFRIINLNTGNMEFPDKSVKRYRTLEDAMEEGLQTALGII